MQLEAWFIVLLETVIAIERFRSSKNKDAPQNQSPNLIKTNSNSIWMYISLSYKNRCFNKSSAWKTSSQISAILLYADCRHKYTSI